MRRHILEGIFTAALVATLLFVSGDSAAAKPMRHVAKSTVTTTRATTVFVDSPAWHDRPIRRRGSLAPMAVIAQIEYATYPDEKMFGTKPIQASITPSRIGYRNSCKPEQAGLYRFFVRAIYGNAGYGSCGGLTPPSLDLAGPATRTELKSSLKRIGSAVLGSIRVTTRPDARFIGGNRKKVKAFFYCPEKSDPGRNKSVQRVLLQRARVGSRATLTMCS